MGEGRVTETRRRRRLLPTGALLIAAALAVVPPGTTAGEPRKYEVTSRVDKRTNFSRLRTYVWERGRPAFDAATHEHIVAAVDRELAALGFTGRASGPADVAVSYATVPRTDIDLKSKLRGPRGERPTYPVATLFVILRHPVTNRELFVARVAMPVDASPQAFAQTINDRVAKIFSHYPGRDS